MGKSMPACPSLHKAAWWCSPGCSAACGREGQKGAGLAQGAGAGCQTKWGECAGRPQTRLCIAPPTLSGLPGGALHVCVALVCVFAKLRRAYTSGGRQLRLLGHRHVPWQGRGKCCGERGALTQAAGGKHSHEQWARGARMSRGRRITTSQTAARRVLEAAGGLYCS
ncbi:MAG: hypothetical protein J3K34DRAFT_398246 [Monoraphidium minutum]|nr:MAG: hypothetical protein J3K34DRAFT_398246 [Monoraphidium minutum]